MHLGAGPDGTLDGQRFGRHDHRYFHSIGFCTSDGVQTGLLHTDFVKQSASNNICQTDAIGIVVGFIGQVENDDPFSILFPDAQSGRPTDDIGIDAGSADVLAHLFYDNYIGFYEWDAGNIPFGFQQQGRFLRNDPGSRYSFDPGGIVKSILDDAQAE